MGIASAVWQLAWTATLPSRSGRPSRSGTRDGWTRARPEQGQRCLGDPGGGSRPSRRRADSVGTGGVWMRILIAEDERTSRLILESVLTEWGHEVVAVADGLTA